MVNRGARMSYGNNHPSKRIRATDSQKLMGKNILLGITGSVASFLSPKIARELIRQGANVIPVMTNDSQKMIGKDLMWWATGNEPITKITGDLEHIRVAGVMNEPVDLMLIAPCTTNTVGKLAMGIADTPVTLIASSLAGKKVPIILLPVAHEDLINSPAINHAMELLAGFGYDVIEPKREEGKAKVPEISDIVFEVMSILTEKTLDRRVIITGGATREYIDNVRFISNSASGRTSIELAKESRLRGADVTLVLAPTSLSVPEAIETEMVTSSQEMADTILDLLEESPDAIVILTSAMADYTPKERVSGKIKSGSTLKLDLIPTVKLSDIVKKKYPQSTLILFKAEWDIDKEELINRAKVKMENCLADMIIANDLSHPGAGFQTVTNHVFILTKHGIIEFKSLKSELSAKIFELLETMNNSE